MIDVDQAMDWLSAASRVPELPGGAPRHELCRSGAAAAVGRSSAEEGLFMFQFEHRLALDLPDGWIRPGLEGAATPVEWVDGVLEERKYGPFRHDLAVGSLHPGHRAKWTAHELCHALVGFGWRPGDDGLWQATAARMAELVPVVLWYFLDEVGLRRCPDHAGPLFRTFCRRCEAAAAEGARAVELPDRQHVVDAARFMDRELAAVHRTRQWGRPVHHQWGSLDLCSDGIAYAAAHGPRLASPFFARFIDRFAVADGGWVDDLDALEARAVAVFRAIAQGDPLPRLSPDAYAGRTRWMVQDLAHRLLQVEAQTGGPCAEALGELVDALADGLSIAELQVRYRALHDTWELPPPEALFAVGYHLADDAGDDPTPSHDPVPAVRDLGRSVAQVTDGLRTVVPLTLNLLDDADMEGPWIADFVQGDEPLRTGLGDRFAAWIAHRATPAVAGLAAYEAALRHVTHDGLGEQLGLGHGARWSEGVRRLACDVPVAQLGVAVEAGSTTGVVRDGRIDVRPAPAPRRTVLLVSRQADGEAVVAELPTDLEFTATADLPSDIQEALRELGLLRSATWTL